MTEREVRQLVTWTVEDAPPEVRLVGAVGSLVSTVASVATLGTTTGGRARPTWSLPADPGAYVDVGQVLVRGDAPWLPGRRGARHRLRATQRGVLVDEPAERRPPTPVPVEDLRIVRARPRTWGRSVRHPTAPWTLTLTGAGTADVTGPWLGLAWVARIAGWPEPARTH